MIAAASAARHSVVGRALHAVLDLLLPVVCAACERPLHEGERGIICGRCWSRLRMLPAPQCDRCGHPRRGDTACRWCELLPPFVRAARSVAWTGTGTASAIVHALKYHGWHRAANEMAARMARLSWPADVERERTALVPVPLAAARERERGFNQSEVLAAALSRWWNVPVWSALERTRTTTSQTRLTPGQRLDNVSGAFRVTPTTSRDALRGTHPVLVDDVITTGATLAACAAALHAGGARIVSIITFARAPAQGDRV